MRADMKLTQADFGRLFGVHFMTVYKWEYGKLVPTDYQKALLQSFRTAVDKKQAEVQQQIGALLVGAGVVAALLFLLSTADS